MVMPETDQDNLPGDVPDRQREIYELVREARAWINTVRAGVRAEEVDAVVRGFEQHGYEIFYAFPRTRGGFSCP